MTEGTKVPSPLASEGIQIEGLTRTFGSVVALKPLFARIAPGGITGLLGPNGSGKSTLLRMLIGLVRPDAGGARVDGIPLRGDGAEIRRRATYLPGEIGLYGELSGEQQLAWLVRGRDGEALSRARATASELGLPLKRRVHGFSHGMKRQLLFAAALAPRVGVRILDEPTEGLDPSKRAKVLSLLRRDVEESGTTVLFSSHHLGEIENECERVLFLRAGRLVPSEEADQVRARSRRMVKLTWNETLSERERERIESAIAGLGVEAVRVEGNSASLVLPPGDPRTKLVELLASRDLPLFASLSFGSRSLNELYQVLFQEEGV